MDFNAWRRRRISEPAYRWARHALPPLSATEREAIEAGDTWWEADLFTGNPDWRKLQAVPAAVLTPDEQAFIAGPVARLCAMLDEWDISWNRRDLPPEVWEFIKRERFFGMIIPRRYGGLGFSPYAHSEVVRRVSAYSITAGVTIMVPNSLGPGELLLQFGTQAQRDYWLPRLADGSEVPCFGLTSPEAGSDAASMVDTGMVCRRVVDGREIIGIRLNWHKRYITLGPVATVLGLAFKLYDPERILGGEQDIGISVALVPTEAPGVEIGRRHVPAMQFFQNGPNRGCDVFVPLDALIGGQERAGHGWQMLMSALAAGRGISLPSLSAAAAVMSAHATGMYARVREQFGIPVGRFEGVQEKLATLAGNAYMVEAARRLTCAALNEGVKPAVVSGIMKYHATERMRESVNDAMDVHAGRAVIDGPRTITWARFTAPCPSPSRWRGPTSSRATSSSSARAPSAPIPASCPKCWRWPTPTRTGAWKRSTRCSGSTCATRAGTRCAPSAAPGPAACWRPLRGPAPRPATTAGWAATPPASRCWPTRRWACWAAGSSAAS